MTKDQRPWQDADQACEIPLKPQRLKHLRRPRESPEARFRRLYDSNYEPLLAYALRRCRDASDAHDVIADTFLVLWRRLDEAPPDTEVPLWLYGVARRALSNRQRSANRGERLVARLGQITREETSTEQLIEERAAAGALMRSLARLRDDEREIVLLAAWEKLTTGEIATVIDCSPNAAAIRLHRARKRLTEVYKKEDERVGHEQSEWPQLRRPPTERREG